MSKRPIVVTLTALLFLGAGAVGLMYHGSQLGKPIRPDEIWVLSLRLLAIVIGVLLLRGAGWARWLAVAWMVYHVVLSAWHSASEVATHAVLLAAIAYALFRNQSSRFFRARRIGATNASRSMS